MRADQLPAGGRRTRNRRGEGGKLRDELIAAARRLLSEAGAESDLTIRGVARAAGVHPQAFYLHFDSLDQLLYAVYEAEFAEFTGTLRAAAEAGEAAETAAAAEAGEAAGTAEAGKAAEPGKAALRALCREYARFAVAEPARYRLLMTVPGQPHPEWDPGAMPGTPAIRFLADAIAAAGPRHDPAALGRDAAAPRPDPAASGHDAGECALLLWSSLHGLVTLRVARPAFPWPPIEDLVDASIDAILSILT